MRVIKCSAKAEEIAVDTILRKGIASGYLVKLSWIVKIYLLPFSVLGKGPTISISIFSNASEGVTAIYIGSLVFTLTVLLSLQVSHSLTNFLICTRILGQ